ncbi:MAG: hypothetical protein ACSHX9_00920 [Luteolibacter sp.]
MASNGKPRPYLDAWLKRVGKQLSVSGRLSELVIILSEGKKSDHDVWRKRLQRILDREEEPDPELLMKIDLILAPPSMRQSVKDEGEDLFC